MSTIQPRNGLVFCWWVPIVPWFQIRFRQLWFFCQWFRGIASVETSLRQLLKPWMRKVWKRVLFSYIKARAYHFVWLKWLTITTPFTARRNWAIRVISAATDKFDSKSTFVRMIEKLEHRKKNYMVLTINYYPMRWVICFIAVYYWENNNVCKKITSKIIDLKLNALERFNIV